MPALRKAHAVFALSFVGAQHAAPAAPQSAALCRAFVARQPWSHVTSWPLETKEPLSIEDSDSVGKIPTLPEPIRGAGAFFVCSGGACLPRSGAEKPRSPAQIFPCRRSGIILLLQAPEARHRISPARESLCRNWGSDLQVRHNSSLCLTALAAEELVLRLRHRLVSAGDSGLPEAKHRRCVTGIRQENSSWVQESAIPWP
jgi:hypothetical protein